MTSLFVGGSGGAVLSFSLLPDAATYIPGEERAEATVYGAREAGMGEERRGIYGLCDTRLSFAGGKATNN